MPFRDFYDAHFAFVWRSLRRLGIGDPNLNDALQDVFLIAYRRLPEFEARAKVTTWLFRICLRTVKDHRRRAHVRREVLTEADLLDGVDPAPHAAATLERREDIALFEAALEYLNVDQRAVFTLFELESMTGDQIAETLEIPLGTVYSRLRLARQAFQRAVKHVASARPAGTRLGGMR